MSKDSILNCIGNTPLIRLNNIEKDGFSCTVLAKIEGMNPGHSSKDRIVNYILNEAVKNGEIVQGDVIVEATSGNTGFSVAMWCAKMGYQCILTLTSKTSKEKIQLLKTMGAKIVLCPSGLEQNDPRSYYAKAKQLSKTTPRAFYLNQNFNAQNPQAHYETTGPEIWKQSEGKITHLLCAAGTGGTLCGIAKYLKEQNSNIEIIGVDAYGSVLTNYFEEGVFDKSVIKSYQIEGLGKGIIPGNFSRLYIDEMTQVGDKESALSARKIAREEGVLVGYSSGAVLAAAFKKRNEFRSDDVVVLLFPDHGSRYMSKIYNDKWMLDQGFINEENDYSTSNVTKLSAAITEV